MSILIQVLKPLKDKKIGDVITVDLTSRNGRYWARRLKDAETDGCCKIIESEQKSEEKRDMIQSESEANKKSRNNKTSKGE